MQLRVVGLNGKQVSLVRCPLEPLYVLYLLTLADTISYSGLHHALSAILAAKPALGDQWKHHLLDDREPYAQAATTGGVRDRHLLAMLLLFVTSMRIHEVDGVLPRYLDEQGRPLDSQDDIWALYDVLFRV